MASRSALKCVMNRPPLTAKENPGGVISRHRS